MKQEIFANSITYSNSIRDLKVNFNWQIGPVQHLQRFFSENKSIRKLAILLTEYDNHYCLIDFIRQNRWIKDFNLDVHFTDNHRIIENKGYPTPVDEETMEDIPSKCRIEKIEIHHGVKVKKARNDVLASFPP